MRANWQTPSGLIFAVAMTRSEEFAARSDRAWISTSSPSGQSGGWVRRPTARRSGSRQAKAARRRLVYVSYTAWPPGMGALPSGASADDPLTRYGGGQMSGAPRDRSKAPSNSRPTCSKKPGHLFSRMKSVGNSHQLQRCEKSRKFIGHEYLECELASGLHVSRHARQPGGRPNFSFVGPARLLDRIDRHAF